MTQGQQQNQWLKLEDGQSAKLTILDDQPDIHTLHWVAGQAKTHEESNCPWCREGVRASVRYTVPIQSELGAEIWEMAELTWKDLKAVFKAVGYSTGMQMQLSRRGTGRATRYTLVPLGHDPNAVGPLGVAPVPTEPAPLGAGIDGPEPTALARARAQRQVQAGVRDIAAAPTPALNEAEKKRQYDESIAKAPYRHSQAPYTAPVTEPGSPISGRTLAEEVAMVTANPQSAVANIREMATTLEITTKEAITAFHLAHPDIDRNANANVILAGVTQDLEELVHLAQQAVVVVQDTASNEALLTLLGPPAPTVPELDQALTELLQEEKGSP